MARSLRQRAEPLPYLALGQGGRRKKRAAAAAAAAAAATASSKQEARRKGRGKASEAGGANGWVFRHGKVIAGPVGTAAAALLE